jgi:hypothetical protein
MISKLLLPLDPLDRELLERAFDSVRAKADCAGPESESHADKELKAMLRAELIDIAQANGVNDREALHRILMDEPATFHSAVNV